MVYDMMPFTARLEPMKAVTQVNQELLRVHAKLDTTKSGRDVREQILHLFSVNTRVCCTRKCATPSSASTSSVGVEGRILKHLLPHEAVNAPDKSDLNEDWSVSKAMGTSCCATVRGHVQRIPWRCPERSTVQLNALPVPLFAIGTVTDLSASSTLGESEAVVHELTNTTGIDHARVHELLLV